MPPIKKFIRALLAAAALVALVGCSAATTSGSPSPSASPVASPTPDMAAARAAALKIIVPVPGATSVWGSCTQLASDFASCPFTPALIARLKDLSSTGYFGDAPPGACGEDYITGTQNGLFVAPQILSSTADPDGSVMVVIRRGPPPPDLTATMTMQNGQWLASDLASGTGASASIFSTKPNC